MSFIRQLEINRRALLDDIFRRIEDALKPFARALDCFLATLFLGRLPADWRQKWHAFVADQATKGFKVNPHSVRELEEWIDAWARFCGLLPVEEARVARNAASTDANRSFVVSVVPNASGPTPPGNHSPAPVAVFVNGVEVAGPGPTTTPSYKAKVQQALETLEPKVANWWKANSVQGDVRSRATRFWESKYYSLLEGQGQPVIVVDEKFTAGQTAQAIIAEVTSGWFADSIGAFYKKYRFSKTGDLEEFRKWQQGSAAEAARLASVLAELYFNSIASLSPAGDLIVTIGDVADNGPRWEQLLSVLPLLGHLPIGAIIIKLGNRRIKIPKELARELENLSSEERKLVLARAAAAKSDDEAAAIIKRRVAAGAAPEHHIATNKNWISTLRGGPWSPRFEKLFRKAGLTLEDVANKVRIPGHQGPHPEDYHREIFNRLTDATSGKSGAEFKQALLDELAIVANEIATPGTLLNRLLTN